MFRRSAVLVLLCVGALLAMSASALADTGNIIEPQHNPPTNEDGWQAGTCLTDEPVTGEPKIHCGPQTGPAFFIQAGGHPNVGFTQYIIQHAPITKAPLELEDGTPLPNETPVTTITAPAANRDIKTLRVDLPPGLTVNPNAAPKCLIADFLRKVPAEGGEKIAPNCPNSKVGEEEVTVLTTIGGIFEAAPGAFLPAGAIIPPSAALGTKVNVYNLQP